MKRIVILPLLLACFFAGTSFAFAAGTGGQDCTLCHGNVISDFNEPNVQNVNRIRCYRCHSQGLHTRSYNGYNIFKKYYTDPATGTQKLAIFLQNPDNVAAVNLHVYHSQPDPRASACADCHISYTCSTCHETIPHNSHSSTKYPRVSLWMTSGIFGGLGYYQNSCATANCHGKFTVPYKPLITKTDGQQLCLNCHVNDKTGHVDAAAKHGTAYVTNPPFDCAQCHKTDLVTEHEARTDSNGVPYNCITCHKSARVDVQLAITSKNSKCDACHAGYDHVTIHNSTTIDNKCGTCHQGNLVTEHIFSTKTQKDVLTCNTCHASTNLNVSYAITLRKTECTACHTAAHNMNLAETQPADIPQYPGYEWSLPQDAAIWAGETWFDARFKDNARRVISNRRSDVTVQQIKDFYIPEMTLKGWSFVSEENINNTTVMNFAYSPRDAMIMFYNAETPKGSTGVTSGFRVDIFYK